MQKEIPLHLKKWTDILLSSFQETNSFGIALFSVSGQLIYVNSAMKRLCGDFDSSCFIHPTFDKLVSLESENNLLFSGYLTIGKMNAVNTSIEAKVYRNHNEILITGGFEVSGLIEQNKTMHFLNQKVTNLQRQLMQEKAELESTMKKLRETQQMLVHSEKMNAMGKLVAGVAHELNNPMAFVYGNIFSLDSYVKDYISSFHEVEENIKNGTTENLATIIKEIRKKYDLDYLDEDVADILGETKNGIERVKKIVEDLRKFSRLDESEIKNVDLVDNINSTISIIKSELEGKNINFIFDSPDEFYFECYPGQLNQAVLNLLINAIQAVEENGKIILTLNENNENVFLSVKDNGIGIADEIKGKIFDPFFTTKPVGSGTGLGLSVTYKIITEMHGGSIQVESEIGKGAEFIVILPKIKNHDGGTVN